MERKINVRGKINSLVVGSVLELSRELYLLSSVRSIAASVTGDTRKTFSVKTEENLIIVTRTA